MQKGCYIVLIFLLAIGVALPAQAGKKKGLFSKTSKDISATAGVRGGDVVGDAILQAQPNMAAVQRMEQRNVSAAELKNFQRSGHLRGGS